MKIEITDIKWETDGEKTDLPDKVEIGIDEIAPFIDDAISDWLSDHFGFLHNGFKFSIKN